MKTSCIRHPENELFLRTMAWQLEFTNGNACAADLMSVFEYHHNYKVEQKQNNIQKNDIAEKHGEARAQDESLLQYNTYEHLKKKLLDKYCISTIKKGVSLLKKLNSITSHRNPNPRFKFDNASYYRFYPEIINQWLDERNSLKVKNSQILAHRQVNITDDEVNIPDAGDIFTRTIRTELTTKTDREIDRENFVDVVDNLTCSTRVSEAINFFIQQGFQVTHVTRNFDIESIEAAFNAGATKKDFGLALNKAQQSKPNEKFGLYYVLKILLNDLKRKNQPAVSKNNLTNGNVHSHKHIASHHPDYTGCSAKKSKSTHTERHQPPVAHQQPQQNQAAQESIAAIKKLTKGFRTLSTEQQEGDTYD